MKSPIVSAAIIVGIFFIFAFTLQFVAPNWTFENNHIYSVIDGLSGGVSIFLGLILLLIRPYRKQSIFFQIAAFSFFPSESRKCPD